MRSRIVEPSRLQGENWTVGMLRCSDRFLLISKKRKWPCDFSTFPYSERWVLYIFMRQDLARIMHIVLLN